MSGDYSRERFKPWKNFSAVLNQQGKVQLDADWNELNAILDRRWRAETTDIAGRCWVPDEASFRIQFGLANLAASSPSLKAAAVRWGPSSFTIGPGRIYVDGLLAENHGWAPPPPYGVALSKAWYYTGSSYTDETQATSFPLLNTANDATYFGLNAQFCGLSFALSTAAQGLNTSWQYWNGNWVDLTVDDTTSNSTDGSSSFGLLSGTVTWTPPCDWATTTVNGAGPLFWVRVMTSTTPQQSPESTQVSALPTTPYYLQFDPVLAEENSALPTPYGQQPYLPNALNVAPLPAAPFLVYVDVWQREVTYLEDSRLIEQAVGVDTTTRKQTVWQVKALALTSKTLSPTSCGSDFLEWDQLTAPSAGQLSTGVAATAEPKPCIIPPTGGYRGLENHLYRVEIHDPGPLGKATFKWSRDNSSMATNVTAIPNDNILVVARVGRDSIMRFNPGDWVEIKDDQLEFTPPSSSLGPPPAKAGVMRQIQDVDDATLTLTLYPNSSSPIQSVFGADAKNQGKLDPSRHTRVIRWDQSGTVLDAAGNPIVDLDSNNSGVIPVPAASSQTTSVLLEDGVLVTFTIDPNISSQQFYVGDFWAFAARTTDASVEVLQNAPPQGVHHHFCRLALVTLDYLTQGGAFVAPTLAPSPGEPSNENVWGGGALALTDCRCIFSPLSPAVLDYVSPGECQYVTNSTLKNVYDYALTNVGLPGFWADTLENNVPKKQVRLPNGTNGIVVIPINPILRSRRDTVGKLLNGARIFYELSATTAATINLQLYRTTLPMTPNGSLTTSALQPSVAAPSPVPPGPVNLGPHTLAVSMGTGLLIRGDESAHMELSCSGSGETGYGGVTVFNFLGALLQYAVPRCEVQSELFDFSLTVQSFTILPDGSSTTYSISVGLVSGNPASVSLSVSGLLSSTTASFSTVSGNPPLSSNLTITVDLSHAPSGVHQLTIMGSGGGKTHTAIVSLSIPSPQRPS